MSTKGTMVSRNKIRFQNFLIFKAVVFYVIMMFDFKSNEFVWKNHSLHTIWFLDESYVVLSAFAKAKQSDTSLDDTQTNFLNFIDHVSCYEFVILQLRFISAER